MLRFLAVTGIVVLGASFFAVAHDGKQDSDESRQLTIVDEVVQISPSALGFPRFPQPLEFFPEAGFMGTDWPVRQCIPADAYYCWDESTQYDEAEEQGDSSMDQDHRYSAMVAVEMSYSHFLMYLTGALGERTWDYEIHDFPLEDLESTPFADVPSMNVRRTTIMIMPSAGSNADWKLVIDVVRSLEKCGWLIVNYDVTPYTTMDELMFAEEMPESHLP